MEDHRPKPTRKQHPAFGVEFRRLLKNDPDLAGIMIDELEELACAKQAGRLHSHEDKLSGDTLSSIGYLRLYKAGYSARIYFAMEGGSIWMLGLDPNKRQSKLDKNTEKTLCERLSDVRRMVKEEGQRREN